MERNVKCKWQESSKASRPVSDGNGDRGYTLTELLVVLVILSLLIGVVGARVIGYIGTAKTDTAEIQIEQIKTALDLFLIDTGRYPTTQEGLKALVAAPAGLVSWRGPYVEADDVPRDPWDSPYIYTLQKDGKVSLRSLGADKVEGGEGENADIGK